VRERPALAPYAPRLHRIRTPEGVVLPFVVASASDRLSAFLIDLAVIAAGTAAAFALAVAVVVARRPGLGMALALIASFLFRNAYFIACEIGWNGRTIGKRRLGLRVISRDGGPLTADAVLARNLTRDIEVFLPLTALLAPRAVAAEGPGWAVLLSLVWLLGFALLPLLGRDRLRPGDMVAGTLVVKAPAAVLLPDLAAEPEPSSRHARAEGVAPEPARDPALAFTREQLAIYGVRELQVLEDVLRRADEGTIPGEILAEVRQRIERKIAWRGDTQATDHAFLAAFYRAQRARLEQRLLFGERVERKREG
jgi:uncharacterized RDD family membrane protein YckC